MRNDTIDFTPFSAEEPRNRAYARHERTPSARAFARRREKPRMRTGSMMAKIGLCALVLGAAIFAQSLLLKSPEPAVETGGSDMAADGAETDDVLGRLKFVSTGGVKSVFAVSQRWNMPVPEAKAALLRDDTMLCVSAAPGETVSLAAAGEVRAVGADEGLGKYVRLSHGGDLESIYYHLEEIAVEEGQPLLAGDTLGKVPPDGLLYLEILQIGEKQNPAAYLAVPD